MADALAPLPITTTPHAVRDAIRAGNPALAHELLVDAANRSGAADGACHAEQGFGLFALLAAADHYGGEDNPGAELASVIAVAGAIDCGEAGGGDAFWRDITAAAYVGAISAARDHLAGAIARGQLPRGAALLLDRMALRYSDPAGEGSAAGEAPSAAPDPGAPGLPGAAEIPEGSAGGSAGPGPA